jgi:RiboL-PSP-HEPN
LRKALRDFQVALVRVRGITCDIDANLSAALADRSVRDRHEIMQCACVAILSGFFETFLKDAAESFIGSVSALRIPFTSLPEAIQRTHYANGGTILSAKQNNKGKFAWVTASPDDIARRLASVSAVPYDLLWEAFADTQANPGPRVVRDLLASVGLAKAWARLSVKTKISQQRMEAQLESFLAVRNECAHTGRATAIPTPSDIRGHANFLSSLARGIVYALEDHLASAEFNRALALPLPAPAPALRSPPVGTSAPAPLTGLTGRPRVWIDSIWKALRRLSGR